jgi:large subunit ribosomal protein L15
MTGEINLSNLSPAQPRKARKRIGRGQGSGKGRYSGRGLKGQKSRAGSHKMRPGFAGGQMPLAMRLPKLRGSTSKDAMPVGPFRTETQPVNVRDLDRFDAGTDVTPELLLAHGLVSSARIDVKVLGDGELSKKLTVTAHRFSASAREKIEKAGGKVVCLREPIVKVRKKRAKAKPAPSEEEVPAEAPAEAPAKSAKAKPTPSEETTPAEAPAAEPEE